MTGLVICKYEEDSFKNEGTRVVTTFLPLKVYGDFTDAQGQLTHKYLVGSCCMSNPFKTLRLFSLPARIKIQSKMKKLEWSQGFPNYNPMGAICCHGNKSSDPIRPKTLCSQPLTPMMLQMKFDYDRPAGLGDIHVLKCGRTDARTHGRTPAESHTISSP